MLQSKSALSSFYFGGHNYAWFVGLKVCEECGG